jgi:membrane-associated protease RseP (regulator of RpoE activity)
MPTTPETTFLIALLLFWVIVQTISQIFHAEKHGFKTLPFFLSYRSEKLKNTIQKIGEKHELLWKTSCNISIASAVGLIVFVTYFLSSNLIKFFYPVGRIAPVLPVVPAITIRLDSLPFFFAAVTIVVFSHELAHGISSVAERVAVKSAGVAFMLAFFGGFVEPNEKDFENASKTSKLRILSAGSAVNLATALLALLLLLSLFAPSTGVLINSTVENMPLELAGAKRFDVITAINGTSIDSMQTLENYLATVTPGSNLTIRINDREVIVKTENIDGKAKIGFYGQDYHPSLLGLDRVAAVSFYLFLDWVFLAAFSVAVFNMLPAFPFDGEKFVYYSLRNYVGKEKQFRLRLLINVVFAGLFLSNVILSLLRFGLTSI